MNSNMAMYHFGKALYSHYGQITDSEFSTEVFENLILFELGLRNSLCNEYLKDERDWDHTLLTDFKIDLKQAIEEVCVLKGTSHNDFVLMDSAREFGNYLKHNRLNKTLFADTEQGLQIFNEAITRCSELEMAKAHLIIVPGKSIAA